MDWLPGAPSLVLAAIAVVTMVLIWQAKRQVRAAERALGPEDRETFARDHHAASPRTGMPARFAPLARATDRLRRVYYAAVIVIVAAVFALILLGPFFASPSLQAA